MNTETEERIETRIEADWWEDADGEYRPHSVYARTFWGREAIARASRNMTRMGVSHRITPLDDPRVCYEYDFIF